MGPPSEHVVRERAQASSRISRGLWMLAGGIVSLVVMVPFAFLVGQWTGTLAWLVFVLGTAAGLAGLVAGSIGVITGQADSRRLRAVPPRHELPAARLID
jgi:hypothetical protein